jgi:hypothetical protein
MAVSLNRSAYLGIPLPEYAHHSDDQETDQKDSDRNPDHWVLIELPDNPDNSPDNPDNSPPRDVGDLLCQVHRVHSIDAR